MRAFVLLCLLHAAFGNYYWNPPDDSEPDTHSPCDYDEGSCGCCLMIQETNKLKMTLNKNMSELETLLSQTKQILKNIIASRVAFSVTLFPQAQFKCFGPFPTNMLVNYKFVIVNMGNGYDMKSSIFTVPQNGVYSFAVTLFSDAGAPANLLAVSAGLQVNGVIITDSKDQNNFDQEDSSTITVALHLKAGDKVAVNLAPRHLLCDRKSHLNSFTGFLVYPTN